MTEICDNCAEEYNLACEQKIEWRGRYIELRQEANKLLAVLDEYQKVTDIAHPGNSYWQDKFVDAYEGLRRV
jgi:hypothetical protein